MSEEEAVRILRKIQDDYISEYIICKDESILNKADSIKTILELVNNIKDKNRFLKNENNVYGDEIIRLNNEITREKEHSKYEWIRQNCLPQNLIDKSYIDKDIIRMKLKELVNKLNKPNEDRWENNDTIYYDKIKSNISLLKDLLGE